MNAPLRPISVTVRPTGTGGALLAMTILALLGAGAGGGAAFTVVAMLCGALSIVAALASWGRASALRIAAPPPVTAFANDRFALDVPVANLARRAAAFDVLFSLGGASPGAESVGGLLTMLAAGGETRVDVVHRVLRRGVHAQGTLELSSAFPLGLWTCRLSFALPNRFLVLPRLGTLRRIERCGVRLRGDAGHGGGGRGDEQEVYGIRLWREGEGLRSVHWKLSARRGRLLVREFRSEPRPPVHVVLATGLGLTERERSDALAAAPRTGRAPQAGPRSPLDAARLSAFEDAVSLAATLVEHHVRHGHPVRLTLLERVARTIVCRRGRGAIFPVLRALAETVPSARAEPQEPARGRPGERTFVVRVADDGAPHARANVSGGPVTVIDVPVFDTEDHELASVFDRRRRPGRELLLGVRR